MLILTAYHVQMDISNSQQMQTIARPHVPSPTSPTCLIRHVSFDLKTAKPAREHQLVNA